jgi:hypothetical protein
MLAVAAALAAGLVSWRLGALTVDVAPLVALLPSGALEGLLALSGGSGLDSPDAALLAMAVALALRWLLLGESSTAPQVAVEEDEAERDDVLAPGRVRLDPRSATPHIDGKPGLIRCWDPSTMQDLGTVRVDTPRGVAAAVERARAAQREWRGSSFAQRRLLLRTLQRFIVENTPTVARVACRDSGKTKVDAVFGEIAVTCEKLRWTIAHGERWLQPEYRDSGLMNLHKTSRVEWVPVGVVGAIVPWNYPCHNVFNPIVAATFAGNAIVIKASEYAAWSTGYYQRVLDACLEAAGAPAGLVQIVNGFAETGNALVGASGADKIIFVGSVGVGRKVMKACADAPRVTPLVLELGGKDPFIICDDVNVTGSLHQVKTVFFEFSLCLSRACLGKMFVYIYKWLKKTVFRRASWRAVGCFRTWVRTALGRCGNNNTFFGAVLL